MGLDSVCCDSAQRLTDDDMRIVAILRQESMSDIEMKLGARATENPPEEGSSGGFLFAIVRHNFR